MNDDLKLSSSTDNSPPDSPILTNLHQGTPNREPDSNQQTP